MKALVCEQFGSLDNLVIKDVAEPYPKAGEILVQVRGAGVMHTDILFAEGRYQVKPPLPFVLGSELSGDVIGVGEGVTRWSVGDRVSSLSPAFGAFAERVVVPDWIPGRLPTAVSYEVGAALVSSSATAQHALIDKARLEPGETLVVSGGAGGTGSAAIQVGKLLGARVIAVVSTAARGAFCLAQGADDFVLTSSVDLKSDIRQLTNGHGADVVFETVGGRLFDTMTSIAAVDGRILVVGFASGELPTLAVNRALVKVFSVIGVHWLTFVKTHPEEHTRHMEQLMGWVEAGEIAPAVTDLAPLAEGVSTLKRMARRELMGKAVLVP